MSVNIAEAYGGLVLGSLLASFLSGMNSLQVVVYLRVYPEDSRLLKGWVIAVWTLDILHTGCLCAVIWIYLIQDFGNRLKADSVVPVWMGVSICAVVLTVLVYGFHALRIFHLSNGNLWITVPIIVIAIVRMAGLIAVTALLVQLGTFSKFSDRYNWLITATISLEAFGDVLVMLFKYVLLRKNCRDSLRKLHNFIDKAVLYTLEINSLTTLSVIICLIVWFIFKDPLLFLSIYFVIPKLHANSFMGSLITRYHLRRINKRETPIEDWHVARVGTIGTIGRMTDGLSRYDENEVLSSNGIQLRRLDLNPSSSVQHSKSENTESS
ncbi:hypothetical protein JOM56_007038 [Amanita muscaria]